MSMYDDYDPHHDMWADAEAQEAEDRAEYERAIDEDMRERENDYRDSEY